MAMDSMEAARIKRTFDAMDEDGSGEIERDEFHELYEKVLGCQCSERAAAVAFAEIDTDRSGSVDFDEFCVWVARQGDHTAAGRDSSTDEMSEAAPAFDSELKLHIAPRLERRRAQWWEDMRMHGALRDHAPSHAHERAAS